MRLTDACRIVVRLFYLAVIHACHGQDNAYIDIRQSAFNGIAAFQYGNIRLQHGCQVGVSPGGKIHVSDRVAVMIVLTGRIDDDVRIKFF